MKTTKKDFELFKRYFTEYLKRVGIDSFLDCFDVKTKFYHKSFNPNKISAKIGNIDKTIKVYLNKNQNVKVTKRLLKGLAFHEVCHLLIGLLRKLVLSQAKYIKDKDMEMLKISEKREELLVIQFTNLIFDLENVV